MVPVPNRRNAMIRRPSPTTEYGAIDTVAEILANDDAPDECIIFRHLPETDASGETVWVSARGESFVSLDEVR